MKAFRLFILAFVALSVRLATAQSIYENYTFTTLAGPDDGGVGWFDGPGSSARFAAPTGIARDSSGNFYVADSAYNTIRKIDTNGLVTTLAGLAGVSGTNDGTGAAARFNTPYGIAVDSSNNVYVADSNNHTIRKISPAGVVTTLAGLGGQSGTANGTGSAARFNFPRCLVVDSSNNVYVADTSNDAIRKITPAGVVSTFAGSIGKSGTNNATGTSAGFNLPVGITMDAAGNIYVADYENSEIREITPAAVVSTVAGAVGNASEADGTNATAHFNGPFGITVNGTNALYVTDGPGETIRQVTFDGVVTTIAGSANQTGSANGIGTAASFSSPAGIISDGQTNLYVCDFGNSDIREIAADLSVTVFAGAPGGSGKADGSGSAARFNYPGGGAIGPDGNLYVADVQNDAIRKITPQGDVSTFAGTLGVSGTNDGVGGAALFNAPVGLAFGPDGNMYVADTDNDTIRMITTNAVVTTFAGSPKVFGTNDGVGSSALFYQPFSITVDAQTNIYVADTYNQAIRKITPDGTVTTFAGVIGTLGTNNGTGLSAEFAYPQGITVDPDGNLFVVDDDDSTVREITPAGVVTTFAGSINTTGSADGVGTAAQFNYPFGIAIDTNRNLYVADTDNEIIRKITPAGSVTTLGGVPTQTGNFDGTGSDARFNTLEGVVVDNQGNVYVADSGNQSIRMGYPALPDQPVVDTTNADIGVACHFSISNETTTSWSWTLIREPSASSAQIIGATSDAPTFTPDVEDTYVIQFQGWDNSGHTTIRRLTIEAHNGNRLTVLTKGGGTVTPNLSGELLQSGQVYSMTAKPISGCTFSNWMAQIGKNAPFILTNSAKMSFAMQPDLTLTANFLDREIPTLSITSPRARQFSSNTTFTVAGTAKDNNLVANVYYQLNGGAWTNAAGTTNWSAKVNLTAGANTVLAYAEDPLGNASKTNTATLIYVPSAQMSIFGTGAGTLTPNLNGALLAIGTNYSITAKAAAGYIFSNWVDSAGSVITTNSTFAFTMSSNTVVGVNFSPNLMYFAQGNYAGLFVDTNNLTPTNAGFISVAVTSTGAFTAKLLLGANSPSFSGQFDTNGAFSSDSITAKGFSNPITVQLQLDLTTTGDEITGTVGNSGWSVPLTAYQDVYSLTNPPSQQLQRFSLVIPGGDDSSAQPGGEGFGAITIDALGNVTFTGMLADGSPASQKTFLSKDGQWPFYISSASGQGVTIGWLTFSPGQKGSLDGQVYWQKLPQPGASLYPAGFNFTNGIAISSSFYDFYVTHPTLILTNGGDLILQLAGLSPALTNGFTLNTHDDATGTNKLKVSISYFTGVFKGSVVNPANNLSIPVNGLVLTNQNAGFGFFINSNQSGSVYFGP